MPVIDDIGRFADIEGLTDIVVGDQHANALGFEVVDDLFDVAHRDRIDTGKGFVEQDELGCRGQCAGNFYPTALTARQAHAQVVANMVDMEFLQQAFQLLATTGLVELLAGFEDCHDVVGHRQLAKDRGFLWQVTDTGACATMHGLVADVQVIDQYATLIGVHQADNHVETGGFARAVGAEQAHDLPAVDRQADITYYLTALVAFGQMLGFQSCHYWAFCWSVFFLGWITMSMRGRGAVTLAPLARPALAICFTVS